MSAQLRIVRRIPRTSTPLPVPTKTPTLRLGSMLQEVRARSRQNTLSREELDTLDTSPRRSRLPLLVFIGGVVLAVMAAFWPSVTALIERIAATSPTEHANETAAIEPANTALDNAVSAGTSLIDKTAIKTAVEMAPDHALQAPSSHPQVEPFLGTRAVTPRRPRHSEPIRKSRSHPLHGYVWSTTANALVRIEPALPGD